MTTEKETKAAMRKIKLLSGIILRTCRADMEKRLKSRNIQIAPLAFGVMNNIEKKGTTLASLSRKMVIAAPTLLPVIDSLEEHGFISRRNHPDDRRKTLIALSGKGQKLIARIPQMGEGGKLENGLGEMGNVKTMMLADLLHELAGKMLSQKKMAQVDDMMKKKRTH